MSAAGTEADLGRTGVMTHTARTAATVGWDIVDVAHVAGLGYSCRDCCRGSCPLSLYQRTRLDLRDYLHDNCLKYENKNYFGCTGTPQFGSRPTAASCIGVAAVCCTSCCFIDDVIGCFGGSGGSCWECHRTDSLTTYCVVL